MDALSSYGKAVFKSQFGAIGNRCGFKALFINHFK